MAAHIGVLACVLLLGTNPTNRTLAIPVDHTGVLMLEISVPDSWGVIERPRMEFSRHRDVVVAMNNRGEDSLFVPPLRTDLGGGRIQWEEGSPEPFAAVLKPGTVYLDVAILVGGPPPINVPYAWSADDQLEAQVRRAVRQRIPNLKGYGIVGYRVSFAHWGLNWTVTICGRKPFAKRDLDRAFAALESLRLPDVPVLDQRQAIEVALPFVSPDIRNDIVKSFENCACCVSYQASGVEIQSGFRVTFDLKEAMSKRVAKSAVFDVLRDGAVIPVRN
jgi:hypothetical protein